MKVPSSYLPSLRRDPRFSASVPVRIATPPSGTSIAFRTVDLSRRGAFIASKNPPAVGLSLQVTARGPGGAISVRGRVARVLSPERASAVGVPPGFGVEFLHVPEHVQAQIDALVESSRDDKTSSPPGRHGGRRKRLRGWVPAREVPLLGRLMRSVVRLREGMYHERLEIPLDASPDEVQYAFHTRLVDFDEEIYRTCSRPVRRAAALARTLLAEAEAVLSDPERRNFYASSLGD